MISREALIQEIRVAHSILEDYHHKCRYDKIDETKEEAAVREIGEETGLLKTDLEILEQLPTTYYYKIIDGVKRLKKVNWFFMKYTGDMNKGFKSAVDEGITECKWVSVDSMSEVYQNTHVRIMYMMDFVNQKYHLWD